MFAILFTILSAVLFALGYQWFLIQDFAPSLIGFIVCMIWLLFINYVFGVLSRRTRGRKARRNGAYCKKENSPW